MTQKNDLWNMWAVVSIFILSLLVLGLLFVNSRQKEQIDVLQNLAYNECKHINLLVENLEICFEEEITDPLNCSILQPPDYHITDLWKKQVKENDE